MTTSVHTLRHKSGAGRPPLGDLPDPLLPEEPYEDPDPDTFPDPMPDTDPIPTDPIPGHDPIDEPPGKVIPPVHGTQ